jgi:WD40 repeat protein
MSCNDVSNLVLRLLQILTSLFQVAFSRDSKLLTSGLVDETIKLWDTSSGKCLWTLEANSSLVSSVTFSRDSRLLASGSLDSISENGIRVVDISTSDRLETIHDEMYFYHVSVIIDNMSWLSFRTSAIIYLWFPESLTSPSQALNHI